MAKIKGKTKKIAFEKQQTFSLQKSKKKKIEIVAVTTEEKRLLLMVGIEGMSVSIELSANSEEGM